MLEPPRKIFRKRRIQQHNPRRWPWALAGALALIVLTPFVIPIHGAPAIVTAIRPNPQTTLEFQKEAFIDRNLWGYVQAVYRDYDRLTGGTNETWYHEALAAEYHAERTLAMIDRALATLERTGRLGEVKERLLPMRAWYTQLLRQLRIHRAGLTPRTPEEPLELMPTPPAQVPRFDG